MTSSDQDRVIEQMANQYGRVQITPTAAGMAEGPVLVTGLRESVGTVSHLTGEPHFDRVCTVRVETDGTTAPAEYAGAA